MNYKIVPSVNNEEQGKIYLLTIYDKGEQDNISAKEIVQLKRESGLI